MSDTSDLKRFKQLKNLYAYVSNQKRFGKKYDIEAVKAHARFLKVEAENPQSELEIAFWNRVVDYEEVLHDKVGRNVKAQYTRQALKRQSVHEFLTGLMRKSPTYGWKLLDEVGRTDAAYENVIDEFFECFDDDVVEIARNRLKAKKSVEPNL